MLDIQVMEMERVHVKKCFDRYFFEKLQNVESETESEVEAEEWKLLSLLKILIFGQDMKFTGIKNEWA